MKKAKIAAALFLILFSLGCNETKEALLVGEWKMTKGTKPNSLQHILTLKSDNSLRYTTFHDEQAILDTSSDVGGKYIINTDTLALKLDSKNNQSEYRMLIISVGVKELKLRPIFRSGNLGDTLTYTRNF